MSALVNNTLQNSLDVVTFKQVRPSSAKNNTSTAKENPRSSGKSIALPEDVVTLSSAIRGESTAASTQKKPSIAVSSDEKQALLGSPFTSKAFSVYG